MGATGRSARRNAPRPPRSAARAATIAGGGAAGLLLVAAAVALALFLHRRTLGSGYGPDDLILLEQARGLRPWTTGLWRLLSGRVFWSVASAVGDPGPLHVLQWLLHGATVALLHAFARAHGATRAVAVAAAAAFGIHPVTVDAVLPISSIGEVLAAALTLAALAWAARAAAGRSFAAPSALWGLALLAKESVALAPLGAAAVASHRRGLVMALLFTAFGLLFLIVLRLAGDAPGGAAYAYGPGTHVFQNLLVYAGVALAPWRPFPDPAAVGAPGVLGPVGLIALAVTAVLAWRTTRVPALGLALFATALAPVLLLEKARHAHYLYLPVAGLALAVAASAAWLLTLAQARVGGMGRRALAWAPAGLAVLVLAHAAIAERAIATRYAARISALQLPFDPMLRKMEVAKNALQSVVNWTGPIPERLLILEPPQSGLAFSVRTGSATSAAGARRDYDLLSAVLDSGRGVPAALPQVREARIVDLWEPRYKDWCLATNAINGQLLLCGWGWEAHARLAQYWTMSQLGSQALEHLDRVLADDTTLAQLQVVRGRVAELAAAQAASGTTP